MSTTPSDPGPARRLHPSSLLFTAGATTRSLIVPLVFVYLLGRGGGFELWFLLFLIIPTLLFAVVRYISFRYQLAEDELVIRQGIVTRSERHIPYGRIQNIDLVQTPLHRLLRVATVRIETASGSEPEADLQVLSFDAVEEMRRRVFASRRTLDPTEEAVSPPLVRLRLEDLIVLGLISPRGLALLGAGFGLLQQLGFFEHVEETLGEFAKTRWGDRLRETWEGFTPEMAWILILVGLLLFVAALQAFSVGWAIFRYHDFTLERRGDDLRTRCGLLTRVSGTIPRHRIQVLATRAGPMMRLFGRLSIKAHTAGNVSEKGLGGVSRQWIAPLLRREALPAVLDQVQPEARLSDVEWQPVHSRAYWRLLRKWWIATGLLTVAAGLWWGVAGWLGGATLGLVGFFTARWDVKNRCFGFGSQVFAYRTGWWTRRLTIIRYAKLQTVTLGESPFDRRWGMAGITIDAAGGAVVERLHVPLLAAETARAVYRRLAREAAVREFRW